MTAQEIKENVLRAEGYAQGFKEGYSSCAKAFIDDLVKQEQTKVQVKE